MQSARDALCLIQRAFCFFNRRAFASLAGLLTTSGGRIAAPRAAARAMKSGCKSARKAPLNTALLRLGELRSADFVRSRANLRQAAHLRFFGLAANVAQI